MGAALHVTLWGGPRHPPAPGYKCPCLAVRRLDLFPGTWGFPAAGQLTPEQVPALLPEAPSEACPAKPLKAPWGLAVRLDWTCPCSPGREGCSEQGPCGGRYVGWWCSVPSWEFRVLSTKRPGGDGCEGGGTVGAPSVLSAGPRVSCPRSIRKAFSTPHKSLSLKVCEPL